MARILSAVALVVPALLVLWYAPPVVFLWLVVIVALMAAWEFHGLLADCGWASVRWEGALDVGLLILAVWAGGMAPGLAMTLIFLRVFVRAMGSADRKAGLAGAGVSILGLLWIGGAGALVVMTRLLEGGREAILFLFAVVWANDIGAYYVGRTMGIRKLAASISPGKTVEGAIGGLTAGGAAGVAAAELMEIQGIGWGWALVAALAVGVMSQVGDLCESFLKRAAGQKDSGAMIPGHGGFLDRIDGLLLAAPPFYYFLRWIAAG